MALSVVGPALAPDGSVERRRIVIDRERIALVEPAGDEAVDVTFDRGLIIPGLIDIHIHGVDDVDFADGAEAILTGAERLAERGVSAFLPTAGSMPLARLQSFVAGVAEAKRRQDATLEGPPKARVLGANLEGPALDPAHRGAHPVEYLLDARQVAAALATEPATWSEVRMMTVAPELEGGLDLVASLVAAGRIASLGHSGCSAEIADLAFDAGARSVTHLFNGMPPIHHRAPGLAGAAMTRREVFAELIADGEHVDPRLWPVVSAAIGRDRLLLVSDAVPRRAEERESAEPGCARRSADGTLRGGGVTLDVVVARAARVLTPAVAAMAASANPATLLSLRDRGRIAAGCIADLAWLDEDGTAQGLLVGGRLVSTMHRSDRR